jgi:hypothetical protein
MTPDQYAHKVLYKHWNNTGLTHEQALSSAIITMTFVTGESDSRHIDYLNEVLNILEQWQKEKQPK